MVAEGMGICGRDLRVGNGDDLFLRIGGRRDLDHAAATLGAVGTFLRDEASESPAHRRTAAVAKHDSDASRARGRRDGRERKRVVTLLSFADTKLGVSRVKSALVTGVSQVHVISVGSRSSNLTLPTPRGDFDA